MNRISCGATLTGVIAALLLSIGAMPADAQTAERSGVKGAPDELSPFSRAPVAPPLPADAPAPSSDPHDFDGVWAHTAPLQLLIKRDAFDYDIPFNAEGRRVMDRRLATIRQGKPFFNASARCAPPGFPFQSDANMPFRIIQTPDRLEFRFEIFHGFFQVAMRPDGRDTSIDRTYMGNAVGHWDGDTLVVEITGLRDPIWLDVDGTPASREAKMTIRLRKRKTDHWFLEAEFTLDDPKYYVRPWSWMRDYDWRPDMALFREYDCEFQTGAPDRPELNMAREPQD